jgi:hypothetical protein
MAIPQMTPLAVKRAKKAVAVLRKATVGEHKAPGPITQRGDLLARHAAAAGVP